MKKFPGPIFLCFFILFSPALSLHAQDSLLLQPKHKNTFKPAFDFDQRFSFIRKKEVNIWGARAGVLINDKFKVGFGAYFLKDKLKSIAVDSSGQSAYHANRYLYFGTAYFERFLFRFKFVEFSIPVEVGGGKSVFLVYSNATSEQLARTVKFFLPTGAGLSLSFKLPPIGRFKPTRWIGINFLAGYRYCAFQGQLENIFPHRFETDYNGMFWSVSGAIFLDRVSDDVHEWRVEHRYKKSQKEMWISY
ncbi:MAG: hypothetical protein HY064_11810 [Bacteroidetes bacterium]|nr:hypothetical protein [Bacteroidota bacterium]